MKVVCVGRVGQVWGWIEFSSSTDFSLWGFVPATWAAQPKINRKAHGLKLMLPASWKWKIVDQKTRTLERHKSAPPVSSKPLKGLTTRPPAT